MLLRIKTFKSVARSKKILGASAKTGFVIFVTHFLTGYAKHTVIKIILLPLYDIRGVISKRNGLRRINSKSVRGMINRCPAKFRDTFLYVSQQYNNVKVVIVLEGYTSSRIFKCPNQACRWTCDRDLNGARNILLRWLTESANLRQR